MKNQIKIQMLNTSTLNSFTTKEVLLQKKLAQKLERAARNTRNWNARNTAQNNKRTASHELDRREQK